MTVEADHLLTEALRLSDADRAIVAEGLLATLDANVADLTDDELEAELDQRLEDYCRDPTDAITWANLKHESY